ncbi:MAG: HAMP domain-containing histidine kinase [Lachnospira sp.]|nr:HAMP domain-containing histidine kinase [Lachnospira sp.]
MKKQIKLQDVLRMLNHFVVFFLLAGFVISCCTMLFVTILSNTLGVEMTKENISAAAKITFLNVIFLSLLFSVIDEIRRRIMISKPTKRIIEAGEKIMKGDFDTRIVPLKNNYAYENFNEIIECFNKMAAELGSVETLRTDFIANVSHELKTPLAVMQNYGTMLMQPNLSDEERVEYAKGVTLNSKRLAKLITNILKLNKLENQQIFPMTADYNLSEQLCECLLQFENVWEEKEIEIDTQIEDDVIINSDKELLELVWNNLLSNAFKFTDKGGSVKLLLSSKGNKIKVRVEDTGCGISPQTGKHIFEKFYQGDTSHALEGNGLGLALVKRVVDIMRGEINVESAVNKGTAFTVTLQRSATDGLEKMDE